MSRRVRRFLALSVTIGLSVLFLWLALGKLDWAAVGAELAKVRVPFLGVSLLASMAGFACVAARYRLLLRPLGVVSFGVAFRSVLVCFVGNALLPFRIGELLRVDYVARHAKLPHSSCLAAAGADRVFDLLMLAVLGIITVPIAMMDMADAPDALLLAVLGLGLTAALGVLVLMARFPEPCVAVSRRIGGLFGERAGAVIAAKVSLFTEGLSALRSWSAIFAALGLAGAYWLCILVAVQAWLWSLGVDTVWYAPAVVQVALAFGALIPAAPSSVGTFHFFAKWALTQLGVAEAVAGSFAVVGHLMAHIAPALLGLLLLSGQLRSEFRRARDLETQD